MDVAAPLLMCHLNLDLALERLFVNLFANLHCFYMNGTWCNVHREGIQNPQPHNIQ